MSNQAIPSVRELERKSLLKKLTLALRNAELEAIKEYSKQGMFLVGLITICTAHLEKKGEVLTPPSQRDYGLIQAHKFFYSNVWFEILEFGQSIEEVYALTALFLEQCVVPAFTEQFKLQLFWKESHGSIPKNAAW